MTIDENMIDYVSALAKLEINSEEKEKAKKDLGSILEYMEIMKELNTSSIEPMSHVFPVCNVFREDIVTNESKRESLLNNAPESKDGCFKVPKTVE